MFRIVAIGGSLRPHSYSYKVLQLAVEKIQDPLITIEIIDLKNFDLPFCDGQNTYESYPDVEILREKVMSAHGLLFSTPEYHGSISGVLKNFLDLLDERHLRGKVVGLIAVLGGMHATNALNAMRIIFRQLHCWVIPEQLVIPNAWNSFDEKGQLKSELLNHRLVSLVEQLQYTVKKLS